MRGLFLLSVVLAGACGVGVPESPTWVDDVQTLLQANCVSCHGYPAIEGAATTMRLDLYDDVFSGKLDLTGQPIMLRGARSYAELNASLTANDEMPPPPKPDLVTVRPPSDDQKEILRRWALEPATGTRTANRKPTLTLRAPIDGSTVDGTLTIQLVLADADHDTVTGEIRSGTTRGRDVISPLPRGGAWSITWQTSAVPDGSYPITATITDEVLRPCYIGGPVGDLASPCTTGSSEAVDVTLGTVHVQH